MHIHFGHRRADQRKGKVADFCLICRDIGSFDFFRVARVFHVLGLPVGQGTLIHYYARCDRCSFKLYIRLERYATIAGDMDRGLDWLITQTFPNIRTLFARRLEWEAVIRKNPALLDPAVRRELIFEPFSVVNPIMEEHFAGQTPLDLPSSLGCLGTIVIPFWAFVIAAAYRNTPAGDRWLLATLFVGIICTANALYQFYRRPFRYLRRHFVPMIARALRPLNPSREELEQSLARCQQESLSIGKRVDINGLWEAIQISKRKR